jgi:flagellar protein FlaG
MEAAALVKSMEIKDAIPASGSGGGPTAPRAGDSSAGETENSAKKLHPSSDEMEQESREKVEKIAQFIDDYVRSSQRSLKIQVHSGTGKTIVKVISKEDGRIIREIPPEQVLNLAAKMEEMMGFLFDAKV